VVNYGANLKKMIEYSNRYSSTDQPDKMGRWARTASYNNIRIAWITRLEVKGEVAFFVTCHFPTMQNDTANESESFESLEEAKGFVKERWEWFLNSVQVSVVDELKPEQIKPNDLESLVKFLFSEGETEIKLIKDSNKVEIWSGGKYIDRRLM